MCSRPPDWARPSPWLDNSTNEGVLRNDVSPTVEAMLKLGITNRRMKDFYDLIVLTRTLAFDGKSLDEL